MLDVQLNILHLPTSFPPKALNSNSFIISQDTSFNVFILLTLPQLIPDSRKSHLIFAPVGDTVKSYSVQRRIEDLKTHLVSPGFLALVTVSWLVFYHTDYWHTLCPYSHKEFKKLPWDTGDFYNSRFQSSYLYLLLSTGTMSIAI